MSKPLPPLPSPAVRCGTWSGSPGTHSSGLGKGPWGAPGLGGLQDSACPVLIFPIITLQIYGRL